MRLTLNLFSFFIHLNSLHCVHNIFAATAFGAVLTTAAPFRVLVEVVSVPTPYGPVIAKVVKSKRSWEMNIKRLICQI